MALIRHLRDILRSLWVVLQAEEPEVVIGTLRLNDSTGFDVATCYDIVKAARAAGVDPKEVADTAATFKMSWREALDITEEQRATLPH